MEVLLLHTMTMVTFQLKAISAHSPMRLRASLMRYQRLRLAIIYLLVRRMYRIIRSTVQV